MLLVVAIPPAPALSEVVDPSICFLRLFAFLDDGIEASFQYCRLQPAAYSIETKLSLLGRFWVRSRWLVGAKRAVCGVTVSQGPLPGGVLEKDDAVDFGDIWAGTPLCMLIRTDP